MLEKICQSAAKRGLPVLLIGGHAVIAHGHPRNTFDIDFVIEVKDQQAWRGLLEGLGYTLQAETRTFFQMQPSDEQTLPVDVMMVKESTFAKMLALAKECSGLPPYAHVVSLEHLLALKCHAVKHGHPGRVEKDVDDVLGLVRANQLDVTSSDWREIFLKYGPPEYMKSCEKPDENHLLDLELPDWSQMHNSAQEVSPVAALKRVEEYYRLFPRAAKASRAQRVIARMPEFEL